MTRLEKALERTGGSQKLAELLCSVLDQFITPSDDVGDWQIVPLTRLNATRVISNQVWRAVLPSQINTAAWSAPPSQCALAWGTRIAASRFHSQDAQPTRVAVLVRAVQGEGRVEGEIGAMFNYTPGGPNRAPTWFAQRNSSLDPSVSALIIGFLNSQAQPQAANGVDLE